MEKRIAEFLKEHHVLTIATSVNNEPWCASCFYSLTGDDDALVFTSDDATRHGKEFTINNKVAGNIVLETKIIGKIRGIQFQAIVTKAEGERLKQARKSYLTRFPYTALMNTTLWIADLTYVKLTDNRLGFGKKIIWSAEDEQ